MTHGAGPAAVVEREWRRFTFGQRLARWAVYFGIVAAVVVSLRTIEIIPEFLYDAPEQLRDLFTRMWPVDWAHYPVGVHDALVETLHIATLGTLLALVMALPLGLLAARNVTPFPLLNYAAKLVLVASRSIDALVWALLFIAVFGPGPLAGTLAIAFRSIGFVGKLFGEACEEAHRGSIEALRATGAPWLSVLRYGYWPQVKPAFWGLALLRWDINVRESSVLGFVGAGGIGLHLYASINQFAWQQVLVVLAAILVIVLLSEALSAYIRGRIS